MECFTVYTDEIEGRIDPYYHRPEFKKLFSIFNLTKSQVKTLSEISDKIVDAPHERPDFKDEGVKCVLIKQVKPAGISNENIKSISERYHNKLKSTQLGLGDLIMARIGVTTGTTAIVGESFVGCNISGNITRIKLKENINPRYILYYLNSYFGQKYIKRILSNSARDFLTIKKIKSVKVILPSLETQNKIVQLMDKAYSQKKQKEAEAQRLLDSINDYVLGELGIKKIKVLGDKYGMFSLRREETKYKTFVTPADEIRKGRMDSQFFIPIYGEIEKLISKSNYNLTEVKNICDKIQSGKAPKEYFVEGEHYLKVRNVKDLSFNWDTDKIRSNDVDDNFLLRKGEIVLVTMGSGSLGKAAIFDQNFKCQFDPKITRFKIRKGINVYYVLFFMRTKYFQKLLEKYIRGSTGMAMLNSQDIENIKIPLPSLSIQNKITKEVKNRMRRAEQLQKEAKEDLEEAKKEVEKIILGER